jgi:hypothetical protein
MRYKNTDAVPLVEQGETPNPLGNTMRDRLIELSRAAHGEWLKKEYDHETKQTVAEYVADHLLANGVIVPPCKVGNKAFYFFETCDEQGKEKTRISEGVVVSFSLQEEGLWAYVRYKSGLTYWHIVDKDFGKTVFLTREEAEKALAEREGKG